MQKDAEASVSAPGHRSQDADRGIRMRRVIITSFFTQAQLDDWIERLHAASVVSLDTETTGARSDAGATRRHRVFH